MRLINNWRSIFSRIICFPLFLSLFALPAVPAADAGGENPDGKGAILLTIFLRHDQSKTLDEIKAQLEKSGFYKAFPPEGVEVVSWYVMMGIGQVVTLRVPTAKLREVNLAVEHGAWGAYRTEFYATYDYKPIWEKELKSVKSGTH